MSESNVQHRFAPGGAGAELSREILGACDDAGFALAGIIPAAASDKGDPLRAWLAAGKQGSMAYLGRNVDMRLDVRRFQPGARSVIVVADQYAGRTAAPAEPEPGGPRGRIARYAQGRDYHKVMKQRLHALADALRPAHPGESFRTFVDTAPVLERDHAARAGLGWIGKHTLLINPELGSWLMLGGIATTLELEPTGSPGDAPDRCGTCTRCIDACPTSAITPYSVNASRCISYLTIERREPIEPALHRAMGDWLFGCDVCQEVCPHNAPSPHRRGGGGADRTHPAYAPARGSFDLLEALGWSEADRRRAVAGTALARARLDMLKRNAAIAGTNACRDGEHVALQERIARIAADPAEPEMVRRAAAG